MISKPVLLLFISTLSFSAFSQKLPDKQEISLRAPANIKIDGKTTEWKNGLQAYNKATEVFYTLSNDDDKLYLTVQATDPNIIVKIVRGGITLTINPSLKKNDKDGVKITYPAYNDKYKPLYLILDNKPPTTKDIVKNKMQADSFMTVRNKQLTESIKFIEVSGVKTITDNLISVYNDEGIRAESRFDNKFCYTYELAIPLKDINFTNNAPTKFMYNIMLNGVVPKGSTIVIPRPGMVTYTDVGGQNYMIGSGAQAFILAFATDFWGEYTLSR